MAQNADTEKVTLNLVPVDLGRIDLLVSQGLYSSRTDLIRTAIRRLLDEHGGTLNEAVTRDAFAVGAVSYDRAALERVEGSLHVRVLGMLRFAADVTPELADRKIEHLAIRGALRGPEAVLKKLAPKIDRGVRITRGG